MLSERVTRKRKIQNNQKKEIPLNKQAILKQNRSLTIIMAFLWTVNWSNKPYTNVSLSRSNPKKSVLRNTSHLNSSLSQKSNSNNLLNSSLVFVESSCKIISLRKKSLKSHSCYASTAKSKRVERKHLPPEIRDIWVKRRSKKYSKDM